MRLHFQAHFDGKVLIPDRPLDLPLNQPLDVEITITNLHRAANAHRLSPREIAEQHRKIDQLTGLIPGPEIPLEALRRENLYDDRI